MRLFNKAIISELSLQLLYQAFDTHMNGSYFAMERRRTFKVNKRIKKNKQTKQKQIKKAIKQQTSRQTKTKQNENIQTSERIHYTRSMKYGKKFFLNSKIQHLIQ